MRKSSWILLVLLILASFRVGGWRRGQDTAKLLCGEMERGESRFSGSIQRLPNGFQELSDPVWANSRSVLRGPMPFPGEVWLSPQLGVPGREFGRQIAVSGPLHCGVPHRNPGEMQDGWLPWRAPRVVIGGRRLRIEVLAAAAGWEARFQQAFEAWLDRVFARFPGWLGLERSVWLGDTQALPASLLSFYQRVGLLHLLSLSGQRVHALLVVAGWGLRAFLAVVLPLGLWRFSGRPFRELHRCLPFLCCGLLCLTSHGTGPLRRTLVMWGAMLILRWRRLEVAPLQWVCSSVACLIVADPTAIANPGVFLSAVATGLIGVMHDRVPRRSGLVGYLIIQSFLPILVFPLGAFFFAQVAWLSPLHSVVLAWTWTLAWVPLAVASLFVLGPLPESWRDPAAALLEFGWNRFVSLQQAWSAHTPSGFTRVIRPTWLEWGLVESLLLLGALAFWRWAFRAAFLDD